MSRRQTSLKARIVIRQLILQFLAVATVAIGFILFFVNSGLHGMYAEESTVDIAVDAIVSDAAGYPIVTVTQKLAELQEETPDLWFAARLDTGGEVAFGPVPAEVASLVANVHKLSSADLRGRFEPYTLSAIVRRASGPLGDMTIIAHGRVQSFTTLITVASNIVAIALFLTLTFVSIATPIIVKRALAGVVKTAEEASRIDAGRRGIRLSEDKVPSEISPLVRAMNEALGRLDEGYDRQQRFIASAAHELRTPIAVLRMKVDATSDIGIKSLLPDVLRLATLAEQLLDLHRLENGPSIDLVDLGSLARRVVADLAPLLIAADKEIEVMVEKAARIECNAGSLERALTNLIQNAGEHGGGRITVRVKGTSVEVEDDGPGIATDDYQRVLEPFHRLRPRSSGAGLGLNLVKQVVERHGGRIVIASAPSGGAIVRMEFPERAYSGQLM